MSVHKQQALAVLAEQLNKTQKQHVRGYLSASTMQEIRMFAAVLEKRIKELPDEQDKSRV